MSVFNHKDLLPFDIINTKNMGFYLVKGFNPVTKEIDAFRYGGWQGYPVTRPDNAFEIIQVWRGLGAYQLGQLMRVLNSCTETQEFMKGIPSFYPDAIELTVDEISEKLGYRVKVIVNE